MNPDMAATATTSDSPFPLPLTRPITWFDLETTGPSPTTARIVEIGITQVQPDGSRLQYHTLVNPGVPIPPDATAKHGITDDMVVDKPRFAAIAPKLVRAFRGVDYGGYNLKRFDLEVLAEEFRRADVAWEPDGYVIDGFRLWQVLYPRTLTDFVREFLGREATDAHRATGDATDALEAFVAFYTRHRDRLPDTLMGLHELQFPRDPDAVDREGKLRWLPNGEAALTFGKHAGVPLSQVPRSYLQWIADGRFPADVKALIHRACAGQFPRRVT